VANFNPADYETVDSRIKRFYGENPTGRITTELVATDGEVGATRWVVKASIWRGSLFEGDSAPDGTGYAFEVDGQGGMANKTSALENCETSAIGRALANIGYSGDKRPTQEEMRKTTTPPATDTAVLDEWADVIAGTDSVLKLEAAWKAIGEAGLANESRLIRATNARKRELQNANS